MRCHDRCAAAERLEAGIYYMRCSKRPLSLARYRVDILPDAVSVWDVGAKEQLYVTPH